MRSRTASLPTSTERSFSLPWPMPSASLSGRESRRLGHSPEVLLSTYAGVLLGDIETSNARIEQTLTT